MSDNADEDGHEVLVVKKFSISEYVATATKIVAAWWKSCKLPQNNNSQTGSAGLAVLRLCQFLVRSLVYSAGGVEHGNDHHAHVRKDGCPHSGNASAPSSRHSA